MPLHEAKLITPDEAISQGLCPECAANLRKVNPIAHRREHWRAAPPRGHYGDEGRRRMAMFDKFIADNKVKTTAPSV